MIHTIIAQERRKAPRQLATAINNDLVTKRTILGVEQTEISPRPLQLHSMGEKVTDWRNIIYAAEWDGSSPWITVLKGNLSDLKMAYAGWPMITREEYEKTHPVTR